MTVSGNVHFGRNITLRGTVIGKLGIVTCLSYAQVYRLVVANEGQRIDIPDGCVLENSKFPVSVLGAANIDSFVRAGLRQPEDDSELAPVAVIMSSCLLGTMIFSENGVFACFSYSH